MLVPLAVAGGVALILILWGISANNDLVSLQEKMHAQWAQVDTVLQRRYDLVPNLVNTVKGYAAHEREILEEVTRLRSQWGAAATLPDKARAASELEGVLSRLLVVAERYPELKADQSFRDLQFELAGSENRIAVERQRYNEAVRSYNTRVRQFPTSIVASLRGFDISDAYFEAAGAAKDAPRVNFSNDDARQSKPG
jgi:LemA protein